MSLVKKTPWIFALAASSTFCTAAVISVDSFGGDGLGFTFETAALTPGVVGLFNFTSAPQDPAGFFASYTANQLGITTLDNTNSFPDASGTRFAAEVEFSDGVVSDGETVFVAVGDGSTFADSVGVTLFEFVASQQPTNPGAQERLAPFSPTADAIVAPSFGSVSGTTLELQPVPEPSTGLLAFAGLALALRRKR